MLFLRMLCCSKFHIFFEHMFVFLGGLTKDVCNCCDVCAKVKGEVCGGPSNIRGKCDKNLRCDKPPKDFNASGRCGKYRAIPLQMFS